MFSPSVKVFFYVCVSREDIRDASKTLEGQDFVSAKLVQKASALVEVVKVPGVQGAAEQRKRTPSGVGPNSHRNETKTTLTTKISNSTPMLHHPSHN